MTIDIEAQVDDILKMAWGDHSRPTHGVESEKETIFTWNYERQRLGLNKLYEKAKGTQWNAQKDIDWSIDVDQEKLARGNGQLGERFSRWAQMQDSPVKNWGEKEWIQLRIEQQNSMLSQFMHGEQGALLCTAKIVETVPLIEAKYYASTQVIDEARHVEVFSKYLIEKFSGYYPINPHLKALLDDILKDPRWDITYLGMQVMVEGLALAVFGLIHSFTTEPLLKQILKYVMADEARHVAFGVLSLKEIYENMSAPEIRERQEFAYEAAVALRNRWFFADVWEKMGVNPRQIIKAMIQDPSTQDNEFQAILFSKIVPNCKKLGLLDAGDKWLRRRFEEMNVIQYEDWKDASEEYLSYSI
jgi:hypothetical protein